MAYVPPPDPQLTRFKRNVARCARVTYWVLSVAIAIWLGALLLRLVERTS